MLSKINKYPVWYNNNYYLFLKSITVPEIKLSKLLEIRAAIPYPGFVLTASNKQTNKVIRVL